MVTDEWDIHHVEQAGNNVHVCFDPNLLRDGRDGQKIDRLSTWVSALVAVSVHADEICLLELPLI